jgi:hypothetical protein
MKRDMHLGGERPRRILAIAKNTFIEEPVEELFNPEAAKTDGNPFPEELQIEEEVIEEEVVEEATIDYESMTVEELRALCRAQDLPVKGKKAELVARLLDADAPSQEAVEVAEDTPSQEAVLSDENGSVSNESEKDTTDAVG